MILFSDAADDALRVALGYATARDAVLDPRGVTVRCTPRRRTVMQRLAVGGAVLYRKLRHGGVAAAEAEWAWLARLRDAGIGVPTPAFFARAGDATAVATFAAPGRPLDVLFREAGESAARRCAVAVVGSLVRDLHAHRVVHRDLYWNHFVAPSLDHAPLLIDVERALRPRVRWRRWLVKDLAGLVASWPLPTPRSVMVHEIVAAHRGAARAEDLCAAVAAKAERIAAHTPKWGR